MKFTIVVDIPAEEIPSSAYGIEEQIKEQAQNIFEKVEYVAMGDQTNRDYFGVVRWHEDDIASLLEAQGFKVCDENIEAVKAEIGSGLEDAMVVAGWDSLEVYMDMAHNLLLDNEIICKHCGQHYEEDGNDPDFCPDCIDDCVRGEDPIR